MRLRSVISILAAACLLTGCSFGPNYEEELEDVNSIYHEKRNPIFSALDSAIRKTFGQPTFGAASDDAQLTIEASGAGALNFAKREIVLTPEEVAFRSSGLDGEASGIVTAATIKNAQGEYKGGLFDREMLDKPASFGIYTVGDTLYYDFADLAEFDGIGEAVDAEKLQRKVDSSYNDVFVSTVAMIPLALQSEATDFSKEAESAYKGNKDVVRITNLNGTYQMKYSFASLDALEDDLLVYSALLFATPVEIPLGEEGGSITITKDDADAYIKNLFDNVILRKYDCVLTYSQDGFKTFEIDFDASFEEGAFEVNIPSTNASANIERLAFKGTFRFLDEQSAIPTLPEHLDDFSPISFY